MEKQPVLIFTVADKNNLQYARQMLNSLRKFHPDVPVVLVTDETDKQKLPKNVTIEDLTPYLKDDPAFFYRQKPIIAEKYMDEYELVLGLDADQIITGNLDYIFNTKDYDIGTVINWNRADPQVYGLVQFQGITPVEYFNCGLVAMRSKKFVHDWKTLCFTPQFDRLQYKEQDILNAMCYYGNWNVRCFDNTDGVAKYYAWHGLIAKGELGRAKIEGDNIIIPQGLGDTPFPPTNITLKVIHAAGGNQPDKLNFKTRVSEEVSDKLDYLVSNNE
jgi:hypothetical protein